MACFGDMEKKGDHTGGVGCQEPSCGDATVRTEFDKELVASRVDDAGLLSATQPGQFWSIAAVTVMHLKTKGETKKVLQCDLVGCLLPF